MKKLLSRAALILPLVGFVTGCTTQPLFNPATADIDAPITILDYGVSPPSRVDGIEFRVKFFSSSVKAIKYVDFSAEAYNRVGDKTSDNITRKSIKVGRFVGPLASGQYSRSLNSYLLWYNPTIYCARIVDLRVEFMDGEVREFKGSKIDRMLQQSGCRQLY